MTFKSPLAWEPRPPKNLKKYGYEVEYQEYEGGHEISPKLVKEIYAWMMKQ